MATFGSGSPGPKTMGLRNDLVPIMDTGFGFSDHSSITPAFVRAYFERIGVYDAANNDEAKTRVIRGKFNKAEEELVLESVAALKDVLTGPLMVRSDEWGAGLGIWESKIAYLRPGTRPDGQTLHELVERVKRAMYEVFASEYNEGALEFKRIKGLTEPTGILLMPAEGALVNGKDGIVLFAPAISLNYLGRIMEKGAFSFGPGFGGANDIFSRGEIGTRICLSPGHFQFDKRWKGVIVGGHKEEYTGYEWDSEFADAGQIYVANYYGKESEWEAINQMIEQLVSRVGPKYLEIINSRYEKPEWVIVQSAPFDYRQIDEPEMESDKKRLNTGMVCGTGMVQAERIAYFEMDVDLRDKIAGYNSKNRNYVAVIEVSIPTELNELRLEHVSNAKAIIVQYYSRANSFHKHLRGWMRETGILMLAGEKSKDLNMFKTGFIEQLRAHPEQEINCTVYADEFKQKGWLAVL